MILSDTSLYGDYHTPLPSREDFHREYGGEITIQDFSTQYPNRLRLTKQLAAQRFNHSLKCTTSFLEEESGGDYE